MIEVTNISKLYGDFLAVDKVSFKIAKGEIVGLLGHNGAGKTTIMKMMTGYLEPSEGKIFIDGLDIESSRLEAQQKIGYLPENCPVYRDMTVFEFLEYVCQMRDIPKDHAGKIVVDVIKKTRLEAKALSKIATLSKGFQQRVGVAQAIIHSPQILILDEPTNGLDPSQIQDMRSLIKELSANSTVIVSTHILQEVQAVCDRVIILLHGKVALDSRIDQLCQSKRLVVGCSAGRTHFEGLAKSVNGVAGISQSKVDAGEGVNVFTLELLPEHSTKAVSTAMSTQLAATITEVLVKNGVKVFFVHPEMRDLESVFRDINSLKK